MLTNTGITIFNAFSDKKSTGEAVCGDGNDLLMHLDAYGQLVTEQIRQNEVYERVMDSLKKVGKFPALRS